MRFFVKVRIDLNKLNELGAKLQNGELDRSAIISTWCLEDDPSVGMSVWQAEDENHFENLIAPFRNYYSEIFEITKVVSAAEAQLILIEQLN